MFAEKIQFDVGRLGRKKMNLMFGIEKITRKVIHGLSSKKRDDKKKDDKKKRKTYPDIESNKLLKALKCVKYSQLSVILSGVVMNHVILKNLLTLNFKLEHESQTL